LGREVAGLEVGGDADGGEGVEVFDDWERVKGEGWDEVYCDLLSSILA